MDEERQKPEGLQEEEELERSEEKVADLEPEEEDTDQVKGGKLLSPEA